MFLSIYKIQHTTLVLALYGIWEPLAACKLHLRGVAVICPQFRELAQITPNVNNSFKCSDLDPNGRTDFCLAARSPASIGGPEPI